MSSRYDFSAILTKSERAILKNPAKWRWISSIVKPEVRPTQRPDHLAWSRKRGGHALPNRELMLALSGTIIMTHGDKVYPVAPGTVVLFDNGELHDRDAKAYQNNFHHLWIHIPNRHIISSNLWRVDKHKGENTELKFTSVHMAGLITDVWDRCRAVSDPALEWEFLKAAITFMFFESASDWKQVELPNSHQQVIDAVCEYIDGHLEEDLSLSRLARLSGYSPYFFHRMFSRYRKQPVHKYVTEVRLERAKELLQAGQSVNAVSEQVGVMPQSYFSSFFRKHTRMNPSRWREMHEVSNARRRQPVKEK